ncbi:MAG: hypothetical protein II179_03570 [Alphaproteobacteria bacterium]|nr:hypothetical protein [Alphaproteobacteria bacterium]
MGSDFTYYQLEHRKEYIKHAFADKKEYFYYRDLRDLIKRILGYGKQENFDFRTQKFLGVYRRLVEKTKQERSKNSCDDVKCCGGIYVMEAMRDDPEFQQEYRSLQSFLVGRIESCHKKTNPAEQIMTNEEIELVLFEKPGLISRCANPSGYLQLIACRKSPRVIQFVDEPDSFAVDEVVGRDIKNILLVKSDFRTMRSEIDALNAGVLRLNQISTEHKKRMIEFDYDNGDYWSDGTLMSLVRTFESQSAFLTPAQLEAFRMNAVGWHQCSTVGQMHNPSKAVKEKAVRCRPDCIGDIKFQYPALQELALLCAFEKMCHGEKHIVSNITLDSVYQQLKNVMPQTTQLYKYLAALYRGFPNIKDLKYQNDQVHMGLLDLAHAKRVDAQKVFALFQSPSKSVVEHYAWVVKKQAEQIASEMRRKEFEKIFGLGL